MTSSHPDSFEEKLRAAVQMPQPRPEFLKTTRARLVMEPPPVIPLAERVWWVFRRPTMIAAMVVLFLVAVCLMAGPQRVLAAVQSLFGYVPGVGFVSTKDAIVLRAPVESIQHGRTVRVEQLLSSTEETVLVLRARGFTPYQDIGLSDGVSLELLNGSTLIAGDRGIEAGQTPGDYFGVFKFPPLPRETRQVNVVWKQPNANIKWQLSVDLIPISDAEVSKLLPGSYAPADAMAEQQSITLRVDQVSHSLSNTAIRLQISFPQVFDFANPQSVRMVDNLGNDYLPKTGQVPFEDQAQAYEIMTTPGPTPQVFKSLYQTLSFPPVDPKATKYTLEVRQIHFRASPYAVYSIDLGDHPKIGDVWPINQTLAVGPLMFTIKDAKMVSLGQVEGRAEGQSLIGLVLSIEPVQSDVVCLDQIWLQVWGAQSVYDQETNTWAAAWLPNQVPTGTIDVHLNMVQGMLSKKWEIQWQH